VDGSPKTDTLHGVVSADWTPEAPVALILFHGYGADERDLASLGPMLALTVPWASLRAPVTVSPGRYAWFPLFAPEGPDPGRATDAAWQWIDANLAPDAKVAAVGFSQGGFMATQLLRTRPERVAATVVLSGFVQITPQPADEQLAAERPAVFWGRGARDHMITADAIERASQWLPAHSTVTKRVYPDLAHGISDQELDDVRTFLTRQLYAGLPRPPKVKIQSTVMPNAPWHL
jgi:phospholipase/carboxylesterase